MNGIPPSNLSDYSDRQRNNNEEFRENPVGIIISQFRGTLEGGRFSILSHYETWSPLLQVLKKSLSEHFKRLVQVFF
jgi:hypothetical protein